MGDTFAAQVLYYQRVANWLVTCHFFLRGKRGPAMETFMSGAMVIEAALLSFLLALWMTWLGLCGLFRLMPVYEPIHGSSSPSSSSRMGK